MGFLARHTRVPMPTLLGAGMWECGPHMVMTVVEGTPLSKCLGVSCVSDSDLERAYSGMANVMLELSKLNLPRIGGIEFDSGDWKVSKRPMTLNMNELVRVGNYPPDQLPKQSFQSASEYFQDLARQQFLHLKHQRNDAVKDEDDCRKKYIARCLFQKIAKQISTEPGPFRLYCDDFRPSNVMVSESDLKVTAVVDWEFTYAAPAEFTYTAPWWLLFKSPEAWEDDLNEFLDRYRPRLHLFLRALRTCEDEQLRSGTLSESQRLSDRMAQSLDNGLFWFCLAARKSFMFDDIYWAFLDERHFGRLSSLDDRLSLLTQEERDGLRAFVEAKMQQVKESTLDEHMTMKEIIDL